MNRTWLNLIGLGVIILAAAIGWEIYQDSAGYRSNVDTSLLEYNQSTLLNPKLEQHILTDPNFTGTTNSSSTSASSQ